MSFSECRRSGEVSVYARSKLQEADISEEEAYPEMIAAGLTIQIVDEGSLYAVIKEDPHHAKPSRKRRMLLFYHTSLTPEGKAPVFHHVSHLQI